MKEKQLNEDILKYIAPSQNCYGASLGADIVRIFPELTTYVNSYIEDSSCTCKNTIWKHLNDRIDTPEFEMLKFLHPDKINIIEIDKPDPQPSINKREMFGQVLIIPATKEAYNSLIQKAMEEKWVFHGFTVTEVKRKWKIFFY